MRRREPLFRGKARPAMPRELSSRSPNRAARIDAEPTAARTAQGCCSCPELRVSMAEASHPGDDVSEQISTAGSGEWYQQQEVHDRTGALTVATRDGAPIDIAGGRIHRLPVRPDRGRNRGTVTGTDPMWHYNRNPTCAGRRSPFSDRSARGRACSNPSGTPPPPPPPPPPLVGDRYMQPCRPPVLRAGPAARQSRT